MFKVNNEKHRRRYGVFNVNFEQVNVIWAFGN